MYMKYTNINITAVVCTLVISVTCMYNIHVLYVKMCEESYTFKRALQDLHTTSTLVEF